MSDNEPDDQNNAPERVERDDLDYRDDLDDFPPEDEPDEGEELLDEDLMERDYRAIPELDTYEAADLSDNDYDAIDERGRREAERLMRDRDRDNRGYRRGRQEAALLGSDDEDEPERVRRRVVGNDDAMAGEPGDFDAGSQETGMMEMIAAGMEMQDEEEVVNLDDFRGPLNEFLQLDAPRREVQRRFNQFLSDFRDPNGIHVYPHKISTMCSNNLQSLDISYLHLSQNVPMLAIWVADEPKHMLELFDQEAMNVALTMFPQYKNIHLNIRVRITQLPIVDSIRELRQQHLHALIKVQGVVTRRTAVFPQLKVVRFNCLNCNSFQLDRIQTEDKEVKYPTNCIECGKKAFRMNLEKTVYQNFQKVTLQESPGSVPAGRIPRQKEVILLDDLIDTVSPGEEVEITGIYKYSEDPTANHMNGFPVFQTSIQANYISKSTQEGVFRLTDDDIRAILKLAKNPDVANMIFRSVAPSIHGHENIKIAISMSMFGGEPKQFENKHRIRGDINVLVMGDPGTAKSQFLKYIEKTAHRAIYTTGKGASAVGLTASVRTDPLTREWTLEGGALVLADQGVCLIDEFDKMNDKDRTSIHEAMEQQSISISKAGIITTLKARCSVVAAANPISGRYDSSVPFSDNVELSDAILSRFDILCVVRDLVDDDQDRRLAGFVIDSHVVSHPDTRKEAAEQAFQDEEEEVKEDTPISQSLLRKYIMYAKQHCHPKMHNVDDDKIAKLYAELRRESMVSGGIPIAVRHIESIIRMSEAHAKMHLRDYVVEDDVNMAIRVMLESFISTQKFAVMRSLEKHFKKYTSFKKDSFELLLYLLNTFRQEALDMARLQGRAQDMDGDVDVVNCEELEAKAAEVQISNLSEFYASDLFKENGYRLDAQRRIIIKTATQ